MSGDLNTRLRDLLAGPDLPAGVRAFGAVGDGVADDTAAIQAAHDALPASGGLILIPPSAVAYRTSATLLIAKPNVTIAGWGAASVLRAAAATFHVITLGAVRGVVIRDLQIQGAATTNATGQYGIFSSAAAPPTDSQILQVRFSGPDALTGLNNGIKFDTGAHRQTVRGCLFERLVGVIAGTGYGVLIAADACLVTANRFTGGRHAVYLSAGASWNRVSENLADASHEDAFTIYATAAQSACRHNALVGNAVSGGGSLTTDSGAISAFGHVTHTTIRDNAVADFHGWGLIVSDAGQGGLATRSVLDGNRVVGCHRGGIGILGASQTTLRGNDVADNSQASIGTDSGIEIRSGSSGGAQLADDTRLLGNTSTGASQRYALRVNLTAPEPTATVLLGNHWGAGLLGTVDGVAA